MTNVLSRTGVHGGNLKAYRGKFARTWRDAVTVRLKVLILTAATICLPAAGLADRHESAPKARKVAVVGAGGETLGMAKLEQTPAGVLISIDARGIAEGEHAMHIHETGQCDIADGFASAGGHFAPGGTSHGFRDANGPHAGDMPNQFVGTEGKLQAQVLNGAVSLAETGPGALMDADGSALVIHGGADDYASQPSGAAGSRIACAVIAPPKA